MNKFYQRFRRWLRAGVLILAAFLVFGCGGNLAGSGDIGEGSPATKSIQEQTVIPGENEETQTEPDIRTGGELQAEQGSQDQGGTLEEEQSGKQEGDYTKSEISGNGDRKETEGEPGRPAVSEDGEYISKDEVAFYLHEYGRLPGNYITKKEAQELGWDNKKGNLSEAAPGKSIGGSHFGNYEKALPEKKGRKYYECDLEYQGGYRGAKRLVYSNDGLIFYTEDHYQTFEQLYPRE